jgi:7-keto-8-aminopelargonate synthetase-like enzyme
LESKGYKVIGRKPCPILIIFIGSELHSRIVSRLMMENGVHVNGIEYPVVGSGKARLRLNIMPAHVEKNIDIMVKVFDKCYKLGNKIVEKSMEMYAEKL